MGERSQVDDFNEPISIIKYLTLKAIMQGAPWGLAQEAVYSVAIEHPEWEEMPLRTFAEWEERGKDL